LMHREYERLLVRVPGGHPSELAESL
jgi:hypothetical protein